MPSVFVPAFIPAAKLDYGHTGLLSDAAWVPIVGAPASYPLDAWLTTMHELIRHPERSSSSIRRAEIWDECYSERDHDKVSNIYRCIRRLLPRRPNVDAAMLEECAIYAGDSTAFVVYTALRTSGEGDNRSCLNDPRTEADYATEFEMPYYHPAVRCVAFHYSPQGVRLDYVPFEQSDLHQDGRLARTALSMLRLVHKHSCGNASSYEKRVYHDVIVHREAYQDFYLELRTRYAGKLIDSWAEVTDPKKHVFEDIAIAAWIILVWRASFGGAPPGGFVDVGCGNGLLVYLLHSEVRSH